MISLRKLAAVLALAAAGTTLSQQPSPRDPSKSGYDRSARATVLHTANVYVTGDAANPPVANVTPGHEVVILAHNGAWVNVFANTDEKEDIDPDDAPEFVDPNSKPQPATGWIRDKGIVTPTTPNGDRLLYGAAAELEAQAMQPHPPAGAASAAHLLYERVSDYFPASPLAAEAAFRSADIRWQLDKVDIATLPSAHEMDPNLRPQLYEGQLKQVLKKYPTNPVAARAAYDLLDNKLCGDWQGLPKCPELETQLYLKYADRYPDGPKSAEALYQAAYRQGVLVTMYSIDDNPKLSAAAKKNCQSIADELTERFPQSDFASRAQSIAFRVAQGIPVYGSDRD